MPLILREDAQKELGKTHLVLIENNKQSNQEIFSEGRSDNGRLIRLQDEFLPIGSMVKTKVVLVDGGSLLGKSEK